ncbi:MAG: hypothetical protein ACYC9W_01335 [Candidatus Limnocylindria bacterium]
MIEPRASDELVALLSDAARSTRVGDRSAAIDALLTAVGIAPDDRTAHRRLAAAHAIAGDRDSAQREYDRLIARLEARDASDAAALERAYGAALLAPPPPGTVSIAAASTHHLTTDQAVALRRVGIALVAIAATVMAMFVAGTEIFATGGPL